MKSIKTVLNNGKYMFKLTGSFQFKNEILRRNRTYLPPFVIRVDNNYISIVLSYIDIDEPNTLVIKKLYLNPDIFDSDELIESINRRNPYFETIVDVLNMFFKAFKLTFRHYNIDRICYITHISDDNDKLLSEVLNWYGFKIDMAETLKRFIPTTTWRQKEFLNFIVYVKTLL